MDLIEYYIRLFTSPGDIHSLAHFGISTSAVVLLSLILALVFAMILFLALRAHQEDLGSGIAVKLAWAWSAILVGLLLVIDMVVLALRELAPSWSSLAPHALVACLAAGAVVWIRSDCVGKLKDSEGALFSARQER